MVSAGNIDREEYNPEDIELGTIKLRWDELNENSTAYEGTLAATNDEQLRLMFIISASVLFVVSSFVCIFVLSIVLNHKTRSTPFNQYLVFLSFPDWVYSFFCFLTCAMSAWAGHYYSEPMCRGQSVYMVFGTAANTWLNAVITHE